MAKKIQITGVQMTSKAQVIMLNTYLISKAVKAHYKLQEAIEQARYEKQTFNQDTKKYEPVLDKDGKQVIEYRDVSGKLMVESVLPFLEELVDAFEQADE